MRPEKRKLIKKNLFYIKHTYILREKDNRLYMGLLSFFCREKVPDKKEKRMEK